MKRFMAQFSVHGMSLGRLVGAPLRQVAWLSGYVSASGSGSKARSTPSSGATRSWIASALGDSRVEEWRRQVGWANFGRPEPRCSRRAAAGKPADSARTATPPAARAWERATLRRWRRLELDPSSKWKVRDSGPGPRCDPHRLRASPRDGTRERRHGTRHPLRARGRRTCMADPN